MTRARPAFLIPIIAFVAMAAVFAYYLGEISGGKNISTLPSALIGKPAPTFDLPSIDGTGKGFATSDLKGKVALVNVWASWCPPCRAEQPILMRMAGEGIRIYGINYKDTPDAAKAFLDELGNPFVAIGADQTGRTAIDWGVYGYPETFIIDKEGRVQYRHVGPIMGRDLSEKIYPKLEQLSK